MRPSAEDLSKLLLTLYAAPMQPELWPVFLKDFTGLLGLPDATIVQQDMEVNLNGSVSTVKQPESLELINIYRGLHAANPDSEALAIFQMVLPHIRNALTLRYQIHDMRTASTNFAVALDALPTGVVLLDDHGQCVHANRKAESIFAAGLGISLRHSRLQATRSTDDGALQSLIHRAITAARTTFTPASVTTSIGESSAPLRLMVVPLTPAISGFQSPPYRTAAAAVLIRDARTATVTLPQLLASCYALTGAECQLAVLLLQGQTLRQVAAVRGVATETCRSQLKSVFDKTNVRRQSELIRLLMSLTRNLDES